MKLRSARRMLQGRLLEVFFYEEKKVNTAWTLLVVSYITTRGRDTAAIFYPEGGDTINCRNRHSTRFARCIGEFPQTIPT